MRYRDLDAKSAIRGDGGSDRRSGWAKRLLNAVRNFSILRIVTHIPTPKDRCLSDRAVLDELFDSACGHCSRKSNDVDDTKQTKTMDNSPVVHLLCDSGELAEWRHGKTRLFRRKECQEDACIAGSGVIFVDTYEASENGCLTN